MRHDLASGVIVNMLRSLKMHGLGQAIGELTEHGSPAFEDSIPILSQLLRATVAECEVRSTAYQVMTARLPAYRDLNGFDFSSAGSTRLRRPNSIFPIVGRVSMASVMVDISHLPPDALPQRSPVQLIGPDQSLDDLARDADAILCEILTRLGTRYRRVTT